MKPAAPITATRLSSMRLPSVLLPRPGDAYIKRGLREGYETMKDGIHPDYHEITVVMTDGTSYKTRSTYGKPGDTLRLEITPKSPRAWPGGKKRVPDSGGRVARFNKRFGGIG